MLADEEMCCDAMKVRIQEVLDMRSSKQDAHIYYEPSTRIYCWCVNDSILERLLYCPWCGKKLPEELSIWHTIKKEYGDDYVKYPGDPGYKALPPELMKEFETDEWWKKRNIGPGDPGF